jgi:hypothetical protein
MGEFFSTSEVLPSYRRDDIHPCEKVYRDEIIRLTITFYEGLPYVPPPYE